MKYISNSIQNVYTYTHMYAYILKFDRREKFYTYLDGVIPTTREDDIGIRRVAFDAEHAIGMALRLTEPTMYAVERSCMHAYIYICVCVCV